MTSIGKAALVIADAIESEGGNLALHIDLGCMTDAIAQALADAGLLMPEDLPEPDNHEYGALWDQVFAYQDEPDWHDAMGYVASYSGAVEIVGNDTHIHTPTEARRLAYALLAAANHAEQEQP